MGGVTWRRRSERVLWVLWQNGAFLRRRWREDTRSRLKTVARPKEKTDARDRKTTCGVEQRASRSRRARGP